MLSILVAAVTISVLFAFLIYLDKYYEGAPIGVGGLISLFVRRLRRRPRETLDGYEQPESVDYLPKDESL